MMRARSKFIACACLAAGPVLLTTAAADTFPDKPIRAIVPFTAGSIDTLTRTLSDEMSRKWGQPIVVENRPGAGGSIGAASAAKAAPDGYTWLMVTNPFAIGVTLYKTYARSDFDAVTLVATTPMVMSVHPSVPAASVSEFLALVKREPKSINFASAGVGSATHMAGELMLMLAGIKLTHIPYKGSAPAVTDLIGGRVQMIFDPLPSSLPHIRAGKFKPVAVTTAKRSRLLPNVETFTEGGINGYDTSWWGGIVVPAGTPQPVIDKIHEAAVAAIRAPALQARFTELGYDLTGSSPADFTRFVEREVNTWAKVIETADIRPQ
jgi:tripartite-type tricarboxylate transporter receptor subunit TctC